MYWENDGTQFTYKVSELKELFEISSSAITNSVKKNCVAFSDTAYCSDCMRPYEFYSRSEFQSFDESLLWTCNNCLEERKLTTDQLKYRALFESYEFRSQQVLALDSLNFRNAVFLLSVIRFNGNESLNSVKSYESNKVNFLSPSSEFDITIFKELYQNYILCISPESDLRNIEIIEEGGFSFQLDKVEWILPLLENQESAKAFVKRLETQLSSLEYIEAVYEDVGTLSKELCVLECLSYLKIVLAEHRLEFSPGDKTLLLLEKVLETFSVAQTYNFIWRAAKDAAAYYQRGNVAKKQAANSVVGNIQRQYDRAVANNWEIKPFGRNYERPQSVISQIVFNNCLHTDDGGFNKALTNVL